MKKQSELVDRVRAALAYQKGIAEKPMFGSAGFMLRGNLLAGARAERVMFRVPKEMQDELLRKPGTSPLMMRGKPCAGYLQVAAEELATDKKLQYWLDLAISHNASLPAK